MNFLTDCAPRLKEERKRLAMDQAAAAVACGVSREMWGKYERGVAAPGSEVLMLFANAGADVQYIFTGVHSSVALAPEERLLVDRYRASHAALRDAALRVLLGGDPQGGAKQIFHGDVGQSIKGDITYTQPVTFNMGQKSKKK